MEFIIAPLLFGTVVAAMAIGYIVKKKELKGSCGGLASMASVSGPCELCGEDPKTCDKRKARS